jgi:hypothetical protein
MSNSYSESKNIFKQLYPKYIVFGAKINFFRIYDFCFGKIVFHNVSHIFFQYANKSLFSRYKNKLNAITKKNNKKGS